MSSCLGLYVENNIIKYAKVSKEHDAIKIDSFGLKFYDNIEETIKQIVNETYSYKTPISVNLLDEKYAYADLFSLLNKSDLERAIKTEFDYFCNENNKNRNAIEYRKIVFPNVEDKDKITALYVYADKSSIAGRLQMLDGYRVENIIPLSLSIANLSDSAKKSNSIIVNIEKNTSVTFVIDGKVQKVEIIEDGMREIFENIIKKENSYHKAYEICKNATIYTAQGRNLQVEENEYMGDIMPVLYKVVEEVKTIIKNNEVQISNIYISGLATAINNIDLYFQENFPDKKCEILSPFFVQKANIKLNIKDYIEVNSAISLALQGLGVGEKDINFKKVSASEKISKLLTIEVGGKTAKKPTVQENNKGKLDFFEKIKLFLNSEECKGLDVLEKSLIRFGTGALLLIILYAAFSNIISTQIKNKNEEVLEYISDAKTKIATIVGNTRLVNERKQKYDSLLEKINAENNKIAQDYARKNAVPNFLTQIMYNIPKEVQLVSITNSTEKSITIEAKSKEYQQLGYFIAKIKNEGILTDVTSTSGEKHDEFVLVTIQGNLPY